MFSIIKNIFFRSYNDQLLSEYKSILERINALELQMSALEDSEISTTTYKLREQYTQGRSLSDILPESFALTREAAKRTLNMRHYDVQLIGGMVLNSGRIAEMKTGEGKTLVATLPCHLNAISQKGVHVITVNDYLAKRDHDWMSMVYKLLGISTGIVTNVSDHEERINAYNADVTYVTNTEIGFDYLRDNMAISIDNMLLNKRGLHFAIIDEVDSILIDEARTPLIISGQSDRDLRLYRIIDKMVKKLQNSDFEINLRSKTITLTDEGVIKIEDMLKQANLIPHDSTMYEYHSYALLNLITQALKANNLFHNDKDYIIQNGAVVLVDEFTGRTMAGRRYSEGLHQALEAKENIAIQNESVVLASITYQNFFRLYQKISGMTGTASTEASEFMDIYKLKIVTVPTYKKIIRIDHDDIMFKSEERKLEKIVEQITNCNQKSQPVLVGTTSIAKSEKISAMLKKLKIKHNVLNAKHHEHEANIIANAGKPNAVTIATNMAGRGTDILLGGALEIPQNTKEIDRQKYIDEHNEQKQIVLNAGGLFVIGSERHESRRIDNQLRGRSGRLGDPGESRFYLSLQDELLRIFGGEKIDKILSRFGFKDDEAINHALLNKVIASSQKKVENHYYEMRKNILKYDDIINEQRKIIYNYRTEILSMDRSNTKSTITHIIEKHIRHCLTQDSYERISEDIELSTNNDILTYYQKHKDDKNIIEQLTNNVLSIFYENIAMLSEKNADAITTTIIITSLDELWKEHLQNIEHIREGVHLRAYAQKDPLLEYKREAFFTFQSMLLSFYKAVIFKLINIKVDIKKNDETKI